MKSLRYIKPRASQNDWLGRVVLGLLALLPSLAFATQSVTLGWEASPDPAVAGYRLYLGTSSGVYTQTVEVGNSTMTPVSNLIDGITYFFSVTAYNTSLVESAFSNEISYTAPGTPPSQTPAPSLTPFPLTARLSTSEPVANVKASIPPMATPLPHSVMSVSISRTRVTPGKSAVWKVRNSVVNPNTVTTVPYVIGGTAILGMHYNLSGIPGQVTIPAGASSASVIVTPIANGPSNGRTMTLKMTLQQSASYKLSAANKASISIVEPRPTPNLSLRRSWDRDWTLRQLLP